MSTVTYGSTPGADPLLQAHLQPCAALLSRASALSASPPLPPH